MNPIKLSTKELIDRLVKQLPKEIAADYYSEMMYCCSLPDNDEMLRILRVLQILTTLMEGVPSRVTVEREALERLFKDTVSDFKAILSSSESYQKQLDQRLFRLPGEIAEGIKPKDIAIAINECLQQQFDTSTIPQTAAALILVADKLRRVHSEFSTAADKIGEAYQGSAAQAQEAIAQMNRQIEDSASIARSASKDLSIKFKNAYWKVLIGTALATLLAGFVIGASYVRNFDPPKQEITKYYVETKCADLPVKPKRK